MLEAEIDEHLGYDKHSSQGDLSGNSRNGYNKKKLKTHLDETEINVPRDRNGEFNPKVIAKYQTKTNVLEERVIAMYAKGMSNRYIEDHLCDIYGVDISQGLVSRITDKILPEVTQWQSRPLDSIYPIVFLEGIVFKTKRDHRIKTVCVYSVLGINMDGKKEMLGIWISENESASFWTSVCNDLKTRGIKDIFIACHDNLSGFSDAISTVFPKTEQQLCVIHQIRNSTKYVSYKELKPVMADLKKVYTALTQEEAEYKLEEFSKRWSCKYPQIYQSWTRNWDELSTYFRYPPEIRRLIYTTNAVEGFHRMLRKYTKIKTMYPTDNAIQNPSIYRLNRLHKMAYASSELGNNYWTTNYFL